MKSKKLLLSCMVLVIFEFFCLWLHRNYVDSGIEGLESRLTAGAGFNSLLDHASIYVLLFCAFFLESIPPMSVSSMIRGTRKSFCGVCSRWLLWNAFLFSSMFVLVITLNVFLFVSWEWWCTPSFFGVLFFFWMMVFLYYVFIGTLFYLFYLIFGKKGLCVALTVVVSILLLIISIKQDVWTPVNSMEIFDFYLENRLSGINICANIVKCVIIIMGILTIGYLYFKEKDILGEKE